MNRTSADTGAVPAVAAAGEPQAPLFLTGFARSGTTWVNKLLCDYFDAGFVNEGQFIVSFGLRLARYGDLRRDEHRRRLWQDLRKDEFFSILSRNYNIEIDWRKVAVAAPTFTAMATDILSQIAEQTGKRRIGSKYPVFGRHLDLLNSLFPDCRVIHVIRDGRDCALSHKGVTWGHQNTYSAAVHWRRYIQMAQRSSSALHGRYLEIRYEDLLLHPETTMRSLEHFITGSDDGGITQRFVEERSSLKTDKAGSWRKSMSARSQAIFESVAGDTLKCCGYPLSGITHSPSLLARAGYRVHSRLTREGWGLARKIFSNMSERK